MEVGQGPLGLWCQGGKKVCSCADHNGRAVEGMNRLRPLERWGRGFEFHSRYDVIVSLFCICVVLCVGSHLATG
jgi:hypothetical protein